MLIFIVVAIGDWRLAIGEFTAPISSNPTLLLF
jgi:hypothetical protein